MTKKFVIYCSGNASRVVLFYADIANRTKYMPETIIYDGSNNNVIHLLKSYFQNKMIWINHSELKDLELKRIHHYTSRIIESTLDQVRSDYLICFGDKILKQSLIEKYPKRLINFHPSLLPAFKGLNSIDQALAASASIIGNTAHYINEKIDDGEIVIQSAMKMEDFEKYEDVLELQFPMLKIIFRDIFDFEISPDEIFFEIEHRTKDFIIPNTIN